MLFGSMEKLTSPLNNSELVVMIMNFSKLCDRTSWNCTQIGSSMKNIDINLDVILGWTDCGLYM